MGFSSRSRNKSRDCSGDGKSSLLPSSNQSNLCKLLLVPLGFSSRSWYQASSSWYWECSLLPSSNQSNLCKLLLIPLGFSSRTRNQAGCSWDWECSLLPASNQSNL